MRHSQGTLAVLGIAGIAVLGALFGLSSHRRLDWGLLRGQSADGDEPADRDDLAHLIERFADALPENEAEIMRRRNEARLKNW